MSRHLPYLLIFLVGLAPIAGLSLGRVVSGPIAFVVLVAIALCYLAGAYELMRYRAATATLQQQLDQVDSARADLAGWLGKLDGSIRNAVRLRVQGERVALPAPALTPYLIGLLVLLGMLGTLLGMMATLRGTGLALESSTDLAAIRSALAAPVKGLGFAFGTSIAGVAASAMLGLLSALSRRERLGVVQQLDMHVATTLRLHSHLQQREQAWQTLQDNSALMPELIQRLQTMVASIEHDHRTLAGHLSAQQDAFHARAETTYTRLADTLEQALDTGITRSAQAAGALLQPAMAATLAGMEQHAAQTHQAVRQAVGEQLQALSNGFNASTQAMSETWRNALAQQQHQGDSQVQTLDASLQRFVDRFDHSTAALLQDASARLDAAAAQADQTWGNMLARQHEVQQAAATSHAQALAQATSSLGQQAAALVADVQTAHQALQTDLEARDSTRLALWTEHLTRLSTEQEQRWDTAYAASEQRQQVVCTTLAHTAEQMGVQMQDHASQTIARMTSLAEQAAQAPAAAAQVLATLRQNVADSMARDTAMLDERAHVLSSVDTVLNAIHQASSRQRDAIDALVDQSAQLMERAEQRLVQQIDTHTGKLEEAAAQVSGSALEVASLGDAFGHAVDVFGQSNTALVQSLEQVTATLSQAAVRSDEQLEYYVAQAREVIDLSMMSQQQIVGELRQMSAKPSARPSDPAASPA